MSFCPSDDLTGVFRAACMSLALVALSLSGASAQAEPPRTNASDAAAASDAGTDAGASLLPAIHAPVSAPSAASAGTPPAAPTSPAASDSDPAKEGQEEPVAERSGESARSTDLKYLLERVEVVGNHGTKARLIKNFVPLEVGTQFNVSDPEIEALRYRLLGTGWYDKVELSLKRGKRPGWVVLIIQVEERRTLVFQELAAGLGWSVKGVKATKAPSGAPSRRAEPYLGLALADTNFLGTGKTLGGELLISPDQQGLALGYNDPVVRSSSWGFRTRATFVNGQEYFGGDSSVKVSTDCSELDDDSTRKLDNCLRNSRAAVVDYWRAGLSLGTSRDVGSYTRLSLDWRGDYVYVPRWAIPQAAEEQRGRNSPLAAHAIDFAIEPGSSFVSTVSIGITYDKRDSAILPSKGTLASFLGDLASPLIGSDYQFVRLQAHINHWFPLRWQHTIRIGLFAGAVFGNAPFFYKFFVTDLTDLQPSRILGLNLDHRPAPNLFGVLQCGRAFAANCGTAIAQMRQEELAARVDAEYVWPLVRGRRKFLKGADAYFLVGLYALADPKDFQLAIPGYNGIARLPIDLTADIGVRLDTQIGVFQVGLAKLFWLAPR
jgi:outer membrane protein insertion porin family